MKMSFVINGKYTIATVHLPREHVQESTYKQIQDLVNYKAFKDLPLVIMPDCHSGAGCVIGTTIDMGPVSKHKTLRIQELFPILLVLILVVGLKH